MTNAQYIVSVLDGRRKNTIFQDSFGHSLKTSKILIGRLAIMNWTKGAVIQCINQETGLVFSEKLVGPITPRSNRNERL